MQKEMIALPEDADLRQKIRGPDFELQYKRDSYLNKVDLHHHDFYEIFFLVSGDVTYTIESRLYRVSPGDILLISPRELHQVHIRSEREVYERFVLWADRQLIERLSGPGEDLFSCMDPGRAGYRNQLKLSFEEQRRIYELVRRLYQELRSGAFGRNLMEESLLTELLVELNRLAAGPKDREEVTRSSQIVSQVVEYVSANYGKPLTLDALAEHFYVSKYHLSHEFNRLVGTSVHRYITKKRLLIARQLLGDGRKPSQVWVECGFGDYTSFYRAFKAEYGASPREYALSTRQSGTTKEEST